MKQVIQNYRSGDITLADVPAPAISSRQVLVRNAASLVSLGTERSVIELGRKSLAGKARARPDLVRRAIEKARNEGLVKTWREAMARLDAPTPLGYSSAGVVVRAGSGTRSLAPGDRVACIGQGYASHAEFVAVPELLTVRIPEGVSDDEASFGMVGAISMHGVRCANLTFGGTVAVIGLGLLGILAAQILRAYGCRVTAYDPDENKVRLARECGIARAVASKSDFARTNKELSNGHGCDAVLMTAATDSREPIDEAIELCREGGKIVVVGTADIHPDRNDLWRKEVEIVVSRASGPGALDPYYERDGYDLPPATERWTQQRNLEEFLRLIASGDVLVEPMITHRFSIDEAATLYKQVTAGELDNPVGIVITYLERSLENSIVFSEHRRPSVQGSLRLAVIGAGTFGANVLLDSLARTSGITLEKLFTASGKSAWNAGKRFRFKESGTDADEAFDASRFDAVVALSPHALHAANTLSAIAAGIPLFIEKPLCISFDELSKIREAIAQSGANLPPIMVGHNRRFSPHAVKIREWLEGRKTPAVFNATINAGFVPHDHWVHSEEQGRSRVVGEMSHFVDLFTFLSGAHPTRVFCERVSSADQEVVASDNMVATIRLSDGSVANLTYSAAGSRRAARETFIVMADGQSIVSTDFRQTIFHSGSNKRLRTRGSDLGYVTELQHFVAAASGRETLQCESAEVIRTMHTTLAIEEAMLSGVPQDIH